MRVKKFLALCLTLVLCLSCFTVTKAEEVKFEFSETFDFTFAQTTGQGVALSENWRSKNTDEGNMNDGSADSPWFKVENNTLYLNTGITRTWDNSCTTRWNAADIRNTPAIVFSGEHAGLTANQEISADAIISHQTDSFGIGFQMSSDGKYGYIIAFGSGKYEYSFNTEKKPIAYYIIKIDNGTYTLLKEVTVAEAGHYISPANTSKVNITYKNGIISFVLNAWNNTTGKLSYTLSDSVTDENPLNRAGNDGTVWLMAAGRNNAARFVRFKNVSIKSYKNDVVTGTGESGNFAYSYVQEYDGGNLISDTCTITGLSSTAPTGTGTIKNLTVPDTLDGHTVTKVADAAFKDNVSIYAITFEGTHLTEIGDEAFRSSQIRNFYLPEGLTKLGKNTFRACNYFHTLVLPSTLTKIPAGMCLSVGTLVNTDVLGTVNVTIKAEEVTFSSEECLRFKKTCDFYVANKAVKEMVSSKISSVDGGVTEMSYYYIDANKLKYADGNVSVVTNSDVSDGKLIVAGYDSQTLSNVKVYTVSLSEGVKLSQQLDEEYTNGTYASVKAMLINNFNDLTPVAEFVIVPQNQN